MCCDNCCTCDCDSSRNDRSDSWSLKEFLDANDHPDASKLENFLKFLAGYIDPLVNDPSWYTQERLTDLFKELTKI